MISKGDSFAFIKAFSTEYTICELVKVTGVSRAGYYKWLKRGGVSAQDCRDEELLPFILKIFNEHKGTYGRKRIRIELKRKNKMIISEKRISRVMRKYGLVCMIRQAKHKNRTHLHKRIPNILNRNFKALKPGIKFVIDITYVKVEQGPQKWAYLCAIKDLFNGEIVSHTIGSSQNIEFVFKAIKGLKKKRFMKGALLHSDQGFQFTNPTYITLLKEMGLTQSMSRRGNCWDNACIENFFSHLKCEMYQFSQPNTYLEVFQSVEDYIYYYNNNRIQNKLEGSPVEYRLKWKAA